MKEIAIVMIVSGGRNGSLFFQSLLDGHPQILQLPGIFQLDDFLNALEECEENSAGELFVQMYPEFFDSRRNTRDRMGQLGADKDQYFSVSPTKFKRKLEDLLGDKRDHKSVVYALHYAYSFCSGSNQASGKRVLMVHIHHAVRLEKICSTLDYSVIFMERDPLPSLQSEIEGWIDFRKENIGAYQWPVLLKRKIFEPSVVKGLAKVSYTIRLEDLHSDHEELVNLICLKIGVDYDASLGESTFMGLAWWGDAISKKYLNGINPNFQNKFDASKFFSWEIKLYEGWMRGRLDKYRYQERASPDALKPDWLVFLPSKYELLILKNLVKHLLTGAWTQKRGAAKQLIYSYKAIKRKAEIYFGLGRSCGAPDLLIPNNL